MTMALGAPPPRWPVISAPYFVGLLDWLPPEAREIWQTTGGRDGSTTTEKPAHSKTHGIATWSFSRVFKCGASWTAVALYLPPKAEISVWA
jgi:hypothetical protein